MTTDRSDDLYHDPALLELCDGLLEEDGVVPSDDTRRPLVELLGQLPYTLEEAAPPARLKERLMAAVAAEPREGATVHSIDERRHVSEEPAPAVSERGGAPSWLLPLAATFLIAVGVFAFRQSAQLRSQSEQLAAQGEKLAELTSDLGRQVADFELLQVELDSARANMAKVGRPGTEVCALSPPEDSTLEAIGTLYVTPTHDAWIASLEGLEEVPGKAYQLWFHRDGGPVSGGVFTASHGRPMELRRDSGPPDGMTAVSVTLEPAGGMEAPTGPAVLFGDHMSIL